MREPGDTRMAEEIDAAAIHPACEAVYGDMCTASEECMHEVVNDP